MGVISFSDRAEDIWCVAGWAFRQVLDDTASQNPKELEMVQEFERAKALSGLIVEGLKPDFAAKVTRSIREVVTGILNGKIRSGIHDQPYGDARTVEQYFGGLRELLEILPRKEKV